VTAPSLTPVPALAAVTILYRRKGARIHVYWVRRAEKLAFLGGFWAFPGGRAEAGETAVAAAARELREETGVVVGDPRQFIDAGRTVTPEWAAIRFDATYYLVEAPAGSEPDVSKAGGELVAGEWIEPADALAAWSRGERLTSPVVVRALRALVPGVESAAERLRHEAESEAWGSRIWDLLPGLAVAALRTPTLPPATHTNCYVIGARELIVIDPASPWADEQGALDAALDELAAAGRRVKEIWLTHHHLDHVSGAAHLAARLGVPVAAHPITARLVAERIRVDRLLADGEVVVVPGDEGLGIPERRLRCVFTPGHAPGHHCYFEETTGFMVAGDMVAGIGTIIVDPDEGDMAEYLASLARMKALGPRALLPAHGPVLTDPPGKIDEYTRHRLWREERVASALGKRGTATPGDLVPEVYQDVPPALFPLAERSLLAHLIKLARDGRARAAEGGRYEQVG
jgi:endoribonuclease LACTB2